MTSGVGLRRAPLERQVHWLVVSRLALILRGHLELKLPKLVLHSFSGDVTQWLTFWDSFKSAIHQLVAVDKFNYLKSLFTGTALEAIVGLTLSASNN